MLPAPLAVQLDPGDAAHVQLTLVSVAGKVSLTVVPGASLGPLLLAVIVYVMAVPGTALVKPSVLVIARSACGVSVSLSVALSLLPSGSLTPTAAVTVAVLSTLPVA